jgi:hypothetical protein
VITRSTLRVTPLVVLPTHRAAAIPLSRRSMPLFGPKRNALRAEIEGGRV